MKLDKLADVRPQKLEALKADLERVGIDVEAIEEQFVRGGGRGGQKINKTASCVVLRYPPMGLVVRCQRERRQSMNRFFALRMLVEAAERELGLTRPGDDDAAQKARRRKARRKRRARKRDDAAPGADAPADDGDA